MTILVQTNDETCFGISQKMFSVDFKGQYVVRAAKTEEPTNSKTLEDGDETNRKSRSTSEVPQLFYN